MPIQRVAPTMRYGSQKSNSEIPVEPTKDSYSQKEKKTGRKFLPILLVIIFLLLAGGFAWAIKGYFDLKNKLEQASLSQNETNNTLEENKVLLEKVGKLIVLPADEEPTIATITDASALKAEQQFYRDAEDGYKVIIYMQAKKAIIYDESRNILVNVGPIFLNENQTTTPSISEGDLD